MKKTFFLLTGVLFVLLFLGCPNATETPSETPKSNNANLKSLTVSTGSLSPEFDETRIIYSVAVPYETTSLTITGKTADSKATMEPENGVVTVDNLEVGETKETIKVKAEDGTEKTYTVRINRDLGPTNAYLQSLEVSGGYSLKPSFTRGILEYSVTVPYGTTSLTVTGIKADTNATMEPENGVVTVNGLKVGEEQTATITVTSEDSNVTNEYKVKVLREMLEMVPVPAGSFQRDEGEENISVITKPYSLSKYQIKRQQFKDIMGEDPSHRNYSSGSMDDPVQQVNWYHAIAFCNKLSLMEGLKPAYTVEGVSDWANLAFGDIPSNGYDTNWDKATFDWDADGYRLPTEMEWMWAAMGAPADGQDGRINRTGYTKGYAGSIEEGGKQENLGAYAWYSTNSSDRAHPVGGKEPNELGLYDMSGNVQEWCWDLYGSCYPTGPLTDYMGADPDPDFNPWRVGRGGCWYYVASRCTVASREQSPPMYQNGVMGFRILRPIL
jgi:sulfatase modifying factor 1